MKTFVEYGLDFDNNRFGFGRSVEIEWDNGSETRTKDKVLLKNKRRYFRLWVGTFVLVISRSGMEIVHKNRWNFKAVFGIQGEC